MNFEVFSFLSKPFRPEFAEQSLTAANIQSSQTGYSRIARKLTELAIAHIPASDHYVSVLTGIEESAVLHLKESVKPGRVEQPLLPLLSLEQVTRWINDVEKALKNTEVRRLAEMVSFAVAAFVYETSRLWAVDEKLRGTHSTPFMIDLAVSLESYALWRLVERRDMEGLDVLGTRQTLKDFIGEQQKRINQSLAHIVTSAAGVESNLREAHSGADAWLAEAKNSLDEIASTVDKMKTDVAASSERLDVVTKAIGSTEAQIEAFSISVREELRIDATKKLWRNRAFGSTVSFWISAVIIAAAILGPPWWAIYHIEMVFAFLKRVGDAATQGLPLDATSAQLTAATISRLVVITAPLALYFWAVKLLVRFNTRSMVLMDDARQRHTTMDTYFHLIERNGATTEERGLMLNALFRPLPGQGQDNVDPPNFIELVKKGE